MEIRSGRLIDIHTHILPGIDDGSRNLDETMALLREEYHQGIDLVVATPHFYAQEMTVKDFLQLRDEAYARTMARIAARQPESGGNRTGLSELQITRIPRLLCGAEVFYFPGIGKADQLHRLTIEGTKILLLEMPFTQWNDRIVEDVRQIILDQHLTILLAHMERFYQYQRDKRQMEQILRLPVWLQVNGGCLLDWKRRSLFARMVKTGKPIVLGSDCHNMTHRRPNLKEARELITRKYPGDLLGRLDQNAETLLQSQL